MRPVKIRYFSGDLEIEDLIPRLQRMVAISYQCEQVRNIALMIRDNVVSIARSRGIKATEADYVRAVQRWVQFNIKYIPDPRGLELFQAAYRTLERRPRPGGDCDDQAILTASILKAAGGTVRMKLIDQTGGGFNHVYTQIRLPRKNGNYEWISVDTIRKWFPLNWQPDYITARTFNV